MNVFDWVLITVLTASGLLAVLRGLLSEALSVGSLVGAALCAIMGLPYVVELGEPILGTGIIAASAAGVITFAVLYVLFSLTAHRISKAIPRDGAFGAVDRLGGFAFGLARGALILSALYAGLDALQGREEQPTWITNARLHPYLARGAEAITEFAQNALRDRDFTAPIGSPIDRGEAAGDGSLFGAEEE